MFRNGTRVKHEGYVTDILTDITLDWLAPRRPDLARDYRVRSGLRAYAHRSPG